MTIDFCVTCAADYALKSQVLAGLPGNYIIVDSAAVRADKALASNHAMPPREERKTKRISSQSEDRPGSRRIHH